LGFMANFGILSLGGIIVNNAVLLLERIEAELAAGKPRREAVVSAAMARLRPIVMTKLTCVAGLIPLLLFGGSLWAGMALTIIGGLLLGTLITLGLVPVLYELLFGGRLARWLEQRRSGEASGSIAHS
jgi:multidrug efflux pump